MIEIKNLSFGYKKNQPKVLDQLNIKMEDGNLIAVLGPNGAGKSTFFKCILGFMRKYEGEIFLDGREIRTLSRKEMAKHIAYIPQSETPVYNYTVLDSVMMGTTGMLSPLQSPGPEQEKLAREAMRYLDIEYLERRGINEISGGERQLALLARAMAQQAKILIMDEPTANLDYGNQQHVMSHVKKMAEQGFTILLSTHNPEHALQYATHVLAIKDHHVIADGEAKSTLNEKLVEEIYGLKVSIIEVDVDGKPVRSCIPAAKRAEGRRRI